MTTRRRLFSFLAALPLIGRTVAKSATVQSAPPLASGSDILKSFDARDWARHFVAHAKALPGLATDEETMTGWFANALMRGYDERESHIRNEIREAGKVRIEYLEEQALIGAVARGWCHEKNSHKVMDTDLGMAIVEELKAL